MGTQFDFSNDDWDRVAAAPVLVGMAVAKAEHSGFLGSIRETRSLLATIADGASDNPARDLIAQAAATDTTADFEAYRVLTPDALATDAEVACQELTRILADTVEPDIADGYKRWVLSVAGAVAEAAKEQGVRVSRGELEVIVQVTKALGLPPNGSIDA
ncbi:MAG: hypothetical protein AAGA93_08740 [Actinomycetota bacterium]